MPVVKPGMQPAVQQRVVSMTDNIQCPEQSRGAPTAFVVVGHYMPVWRQADTAEYFGQMRFAWQHSHGGRTCRDDLRIVDMYRARHVGLRIGFGSTQIDNQKVFCVQIPDQLRRLDDKRQKRLDHDSFVDAMNQWELSDGIF